MNIFVALVACGQMPADVKFAGEETVTVHTTEPVPVQAATVMDKAGKPLEGKTDIQWSVSPEGIAKLDGDKLVPEKSGKAMVKACATDKICKEYTFVVALPDKVVVNAPEGAEWKVGGKVPLMAKVLSGETEVPNQKATWTADPPTIVVVDENGVASAVAVGAGKVTAKVGELTGELPVTVVEGTAAPTN